MNKDLVKKKEKRLVLDKNEIQINLCILFSFEDLNNNYLDKCKKLLFILMDILTFL